MPVLAVLPWVLSVLVFQAAAEPETQRKPVELLFEGVPGCSEAEVFLDQVRARTQRVRRAEGEEPRTLLQVRLSQAHGKIVGELSIVDDRGRADTRKVQGTLCRDVLSALSLTAALALDPAALHPSEPTSEGDPVSTENSSPQEPKPDTTPKAPPPPLEPPMDPLPPPRPLPEFELGVGVAGMTVLKGGGSTGPSVSARKTLGSGDGFRPVVGVAVSYLRDDFFSSPPDARATYADFGLSVCPAHLSAGPFSAEPCVIGRAGWLRVTGHRENHVETVDRLWSAAGLSVRAAVYLGHGLSLALEGGALAPLVKRRFYASLPSNIVAETPRISPLVGVGLTYTP